MKIGVCREIREAERRVALCPDLVRKLTHSNDDVLLEHASLPYPSVLEAPLGLLNSGDGKIALDSDNDQIAGACTTLGAEVIHDGPSAATSSAQGR
jgi:hypothetical protein